MTNTGIETDYKIQTLTDEHVKATAELFTKCFCDSEPITMHLGIRYQDYQLFALEVVQKAAKEGMSKVAVDKHHRVIACSISEDMSDPFVPHLAHYPKLKPIIDLLDDLSMPFLSGKKFIKGKVVHIWIGAVDSAYRGHGLLTEIGMACIDAAARKGFDFVYTEFTNPVSENVTHHFKVLELCNRIFYDDYVRDNQKPFKGVSGSADSFVAAIRPGVNLEGLAHCYQNKENSH